MLERLDQRLVALGLCPSRERAQALILGGHVEVNGQVAKKAGDRVAEGAEVRIKGEALPYVSRGGLKLRHALDYFGIDHSPPGRNRTFPFRLSGECTALVLQAGRADRARV